MGWWWLGGGGSALLFPASDTLYGRHAGSPSRGKEPGQHQVPRPPGGADGRKFDWNKFLSRVAFTRAFLALKTRQVQVQNVLRKS